MKSFYLPLLICLLPLAFFAQPPCEQRLNEATLDYESGLLRDALDNLLPCIESEGIRQAKKADMLELLTEIQLELKDYEQASQTYITLLNTEPLYYPLPGASSRQLQNLAKQHRSLPFLSFSGQVGVSFSKPNPSAVYSLPAVNIRKESYEADPVGTSVGASVGLAVLPRLEIMLEGFYRKNFYSYTGTYDNARHQGSGMRSSGTLKFLERQDWISIPVSLRFYLRQRDSWYRQPVKNRLLHRVIPFVYSGLGLDILSSAEIPLPFMIIFPELATNTIANKNIDLIEEGLRNNSNYTIFGGVGAQYQFKNGYCFFDLRYSSTLNNVVDEENRVSSYRLTEVYNYLDNDFRMNSYYLSLGAGVFIYKVKKGILP